MALSDADIEQLLVEAETRLSAKTSRTTTIAAKPPSTLAASRDSGLDAIAKPRASGQKSDLGVRIPQLAAKRTKNTDNAGPKWFNMPRTNLTPELKKDLQLLRMRSILNTGQFFKKDGRKNPVPEFSQVGTIISGPTDPAASRLTRRERKRTIVEEVLASNDVMAKFKTRYGKVQERKTSGRKAHYKNVVAQRRRGR